MEGAMHKPEPSNWVEAELVWGLRQTSAPAELWDRVRMGYTAEPAAERRFDSRVNYAMAAAAVLLAVALGLGLRQIAGVRAERGDSQFAGYRCQNPAELRAWVKANTGLDIPLREAALREGPAASLQLIGARTVGAGVEVAYRAGNRDGVLLVSRADARAQDILHGHASGRSASWVMAGERYTLECNDAASLQLACKLCHLD
jgi:hypothetical protein